MVRTDFVAGHQISSGRPAAGEAGGRVGDNGRELFRGVVCGRRMEVIGVGREAGADEEGEDEEAVEERGSE